MGIYKTYKYIYIKFYKWAENLHGNNESHEFTAFFSLTFLVYANLVSVFLALKLILNFSISHLELSKLDICIYSLLPAIPQYFLLLHKKKYLKILKEFGTPAPARILSCGDKRHNPDVAESNLANNIQASGSVVNQALQNASGSGGFSSSWYDFWGGAASQGTNNPLNWTGR